MKPLYRMSALMVSLLCLASFDALAKGSSTKVSGLINLNQAGASELAKLPRVGMKGAEKIVAYRSKQPFKRVEELAKIKGFGHKKFEKIRPFLAVAGPTTLKKERIATRK